jgi:dihydrofolate reductase
MRKIFWQINITLDGYMARPDGDLTETAEVADPKFELYASEMLRSIDGFIVGRKTYELFAGYWPDQVGPDADNLNTMPKYVVSTTLRSVGWNNSRLMHSVGELDKLKHQDGRDIAVFGSAQLASSLLEHGLVDELRVFVTPFLLGRGSPAFKPASKTRKLDLVGSEKWESGVLGLTYRIA